MVIMKGRIVNSLKIYLGEIVDPMRRGRPVVRWKDRVKEYMYERITDRWGGIELANGECLYRER